MISALQLSRLWCVVFLGAGTFYDPGVMSAAWKFRRGLLHASYAGGVSLL